MRRPFAIVVGSLAAALYSPQCAAQASQPIVSAAPGVARAQPGCDSDSPAEVVVCGKPAERYRIEPNVLAATRAAEALPPKAPLDATAPEGCVGPNCGGGTIPLVGMALTAIEAASLAAQGDDWREAFRTHPDQYQAYLQSKATHKGGISIGVSVGNRER